VEIKLEDKTKNACCRTTSPWAIRGNKAYAAHVLLGHSRGAVAARAGCHRMGLRGRRRRADPGRAAGGPACTLARRRFLAGTWRAPLQGGRRSPVVSAGGGRAGRRGPGPFSACGGWVAPGRPPSDLASPRAGPLAAHPAPGACPASRAPAGPDGPRRPCRGAAGGGGSDRGMRRPRGGGGERRRQPRGEGECGVFFYFTRGNRGSNAERDSNAGRGPCGYAAAGAKGYALKRGSLEAEPFDRVEVR